MIRDVHSTIQDFKQWRQLGLEIALELPELDMHKIIQDMSDKFNSLVMDVHIDQERDRIKNDLRVIHK